MNTSLIAQAILARIQADTTLYTGGAYQAPLLGGAFEMWGDLDDENTVTPFLTYSISVEDDQFLAGAMHPFTITFRIVASPRTSQNTRANVTTLLDRLYGNCITALDQVPSYGFHLHHLALDSNQSNNPNQWQVGILRLVSSVQEPIDTRFYSITMTFRGEISANASQIVPP